MGQQTVLLAALDLVAIKKVRGRPLRSEEEPILARRGGEAAFLKEGAERSNAGARPNHDERRIRRRRTKGVVGMHKDRHRCVGVRAVGEKGRADAGSASSQAFVT